MKIECKLLREGGTVVELDGIEYHFAPQADGAHVAEVQDERHQDKLLAISEGYRLYRGKAAAEARIEPADGPHDHLAADTNGDGAVDGDEELDALREQHKAKFGSYPHARTKADTIRAKLAE